MPITAGSISVARHINTGDDYSHKKAEAVVHYTVEPEEDLAEVADTASMQALTQVAKVLATQVTLAATPEIKLGTQPENQKSAQVEQVEEQKKRHRRTKAQMEAARVAPEPQYPLPLDPTPTSTEPSTTNSSEGTSATPVEDTTSPYILPLPVVQDLVWMDPTLPAASTVAETSAETTRGGTASTPEISDKVLNNACNETMNRIKNKVAIQGIIQQYTDGAVSTIPQENRIEFLSKLKAL